MTLQKIRKEVHACSLCPLVLPDANIPPVGRSDARVFILGQSPGFDEVEYGTPFVGVCGQLLDKFLDEAGLKRTDVFIMNALNCRPPGNRQGRPEELTNCRKYVVAALKIVQPRVLVLLGKDAYRLVDKWIPWPKGPEKTVIVSAIRPIVFVSWHPSAYLRNGTDSVFIEKGRALAQALDTAAADQL